jgi:uncharacterized caspase-like protein
MRSLEHDFAAIARIIDDNDLCLFFFSGHGLFAPTGGAEDVILFERPTLINAAILGAQ